MNVGIICEYNPFHNGHVYHVKKIREEFGEDANIIAVMSGNFVQRGGVAIADKALRAKCAIMSGINLVLELPFPFSMSSAEFFAKSAIHILNNLGCIDYVSFGSESGDVSALENTANLMLSDEFSSEYSRLQKNADTRKLGHAALCEATLKKLSPSSDLAVSLTPNNILGIEYIKALKTSGSKIMPHTIKREGNAFSDENLVPGSIQSATAIRNSIEAKDISALEYTPNTAKALILDAISSGDFPCDNERISAAIIASLRVNPPISQTDIHDTVGGLYNRLRDLSFETNSIESLICAAESKNFTKARIRRTLFYSLMGVTSSHFNELPLYTQILALDSFGRAILKNIGKQSSISILTKPSDFSSLDESALKQKLLSDVADSVFQMTKPIPKSGNSSLRFTPFVKK